MTSTDDGAVRAFATDDEVRQALEVGMKRWATLLDRLGEERHVPHTPQGDAMTAYTRPDPARAYKAYVSAALTAASVFAVYWLADKGAFTTRDIIEALVAAAAASGLTGFGTYRVKNPAKVQRGEAGESAVLVLIAVAVAVIALVLLLPALQR